MESFTWEPCFVTGVPVVDEQHRRLVDVINRFGELLMQPGGAGADDVERVFGELARYAQVHFRDEEHLMAVSGLDTQYRAQHQREHAGFLQDVVRLRADARAGDAESARGLQHFLVDWLAYHILGQDQAMARQLDDVASGVPADEAWRRSHKERDPATTALLHALERLLRHVSDRNRALHELNQSLEARVAERTSALSQANRQLADLALTDVLTGLANRRHALQILQQEWLAARRHGTPLSCLMIDADGFKTVNDTLGHDAGDRVLRLLASCLGDSVRTDDTVCRLGGDEFLVICAHTPPVGALQLADKLCAQVRGLRVDLGGQPWQGSISVGVAAMDDGMQGVDELLKASDANLYRAKQAGRNRAVMS